MINCQSGRVYLMLPRVYLISCMIHCRSGGVYLMLPGVYLTSCMIHCRSGGVYLISSERFDNNVQCHN